MSFSYEYKWDYYPLFVARDITSSDSISGNLTIKLYPYWFKQITLEWKIPGDWGASTFNVYHAQTEVGPFKKLNATPLGTSTNFFKDLTTQDYSKFHRGWYIVEATLPSGKRVQSKPATWEQSRKPWVELRAQEIQRREYLLLRKFTGIDSYIIRRKTYGARCKNCWNFDLEKIVKDKCTNCYGTSFDGGYFPSVNTLVMYDTNPNDIQLTYFGKWEQNETLAWTIAFPEARARDLIYRAADGALFEISDWKNTELQTVTVRQIFKIVQLDKESSEYQAILDNNIIPAQYQT